jgi:hypothetical protein
VYSLVLKIGGGVNDPIPEKFVTKPPETYGGGQDPHRVVRQKRSLLINRIKQHEIG